MKKYYRFTSWIVDKHVRRDYRVHEFTFKKAALMAMADCAKEGRQCSYLEEGRY